MWTFTIVVPLLEVRSLQEAVRKEKYGMLSARNPRKTEGPFYVWCSVVNIALALYSLQQKAFIQQDT